MQLAPHTLFELPPGMIDDPYNEFFVEEFGEGCQLEQVQRKYELVYDTYWEKRYSLNIQQVGSVSVCTF